VQAVSNNQPSRHRLRKAIALLTIAIIAAFLPPLQPKPLHAAPQEEYEQHDEVVANLAAGRVIVAVFKDAILIASIENHIEPDSLAPAIVPLAARRVAILLGAISWNSPSPPVEWARLDTEIPNLHAHIAIAITPHMQGSSAGEEAKDIEDVGEGLRVRLSNMMKRVHGPLDLPPDQPLIELVLADYQVDYGAEVWTLQYGLNQQPERGEFWDTKIQRPRYSQLWPPEKTAPHTVMEIQYPPTAEKSPTLLDLLRQKDPRLQAISQSDPQMATVAATVLSGDTSKLLQAAAVPYFRACFNALTPPNAALAIALIDREQGFQWLLAPPPPPPPAKNSKLHLPEQDQARPPDAPSLLKPPPK
jgi:hypothetical protein